MQYILGTNPIGAYQKMFECLGELRPRTIERFKQRFVRDELDTTNLYYTAEGAKLIILSPTCSIIEVLHLPMSLLLMDDEAWSNHLKEVHK